MSGLLENIGSILTSVIGWLGQIAASLLTNPIFVVVIAVSILILIYNIILDIINIRRMNWLHKNYDYEGEYNNLNNKPIEEWTDEDYDEDVLWSYTHSDY